MVSCYLNTDNIVTNLWLSIFSNEINDLTYHIIGASYKVHYAFGPSLLESAYEACLAYEIRKLNYYIEVQKPLPVMYEAVKLDAGYSIDLLVEKSVIVDLKEVEAINDIHNAQILIYLKLANLKVGLLINLNVKDLKQCIKRFIL